MSCWIRLVSDLNPQSQSRSEEEEFDCYGRRQITYNSRVTPITTHMIDHDTLKGLLRINDELFQVCKWLNEKREIEISSRLVLLDFPHL